jgi:nucleoside 2-deoxyribosyltransferase
MAKDDFEQYRIGYHIRSTAEVLKEIITIIMALAFAQAIITFLTNEAGGPNKIDQFTWTHAAAFICVIITIVRFFHGNISYLIRTYNLPDHEATARKHNFKLALDFIFIFAQSFLFCALAWYQRNDLEFYILFTVLFFVDAIWFFTIIMFAKGSFKDFEANQAQEQTRTLTNWMAANALTGILMLVFILPRIAQPNPNFEPLIPIFFVIIMSNTVIDYILNRRLYFPLGTKHNKRKTVFVAARFSSAINSDVFDPGLRKTIETVHHNVTQRGFDLHSAHIDELFGKKPEQPSNFIVRDISKISSCDIFIALIDNLQSVGTNIELGWASFLGKYIILLFPESFDHDLAPMLSGISQLTQCDELIYKDNDDLRDKLYIILERLSM